MILPVFNEEDRLAQTVAAVRDVLDRDFSAFEHEIVLVDDASTDRSPVIGAAFAQFSNAIRYIRHDENRGVDAGIRTGIQAAQGDVLVVLDADLSYKASIMRELIAPILSGSADISLASAYAPGGAVQNVPLARALMSRWANRYLSRISSARAHTFTCIVRAYSSKAARDLFNSGDPVHTMLLEAMKRGYTIAEIPATLAWPGNRQSRLRLFATLQRTLDVLSSGARFRSGLASSTPLPTRRIATYL